MFKIVESGWQNHGGNDWGTSRSFTATCWIQCSGRKTWRPSAEARLIRWRTWRSSTAAELRRSHIDRRFHKPKTVCGHGVFFVPDS